MEIKGLSPYSGKDPGSGKEPGENRQMPASAAAGAPASRANLPPAATPPMAAGDTAQFKQPQSDLTRPQAVDATTQQASTGGKPTPSPVTLQFLGAGFERLASMAASFFKANQRDTVDEEFAERWERVELDNPDLFDQQSKVKNAHQSNLGGNQ